MGIFVLCWIRNCRGGSSRPFSLCEESGTRLKHAGLRACALGDSQSHVWVITVCTMCVRVSREWGVRLSPAGGNQLSQPVTHPLPVTRGSRQKSGQRRAGAWEQWKQEAGYSRGRHQPLPTKPQPPVQVVSWGLESGMALRRPRNNQSLLQQVGCKLPRPFTNQWVCTKYRKNVLYPLPLPLRVWNARCFNAHRTKGHHFKHQVFDSECLSYKHPWGVRSERKGRPIPSLD